MKLSEVKKYKRIVAIIGKDTVIALCKEFKKERIRPSALLHYIESEELAEAYDASVSVEYYADEKGVSPNRVYRAIQEYR